MKIYYNKPTAEISIKMNMFEFQILNELLEDHESETFGYDFKKWEQPVINHIKETLKQNQSFINKKNK